MSSLQDKVVIVTGASSGIGASTCVHLAEYGVKLVLAARNLENLQKTAQQCQEQGLEQSKILVVQCDVNKDENLRDLVDKTLSQFGRIDVLVNNAGGGKYTKFLDTPMDVFDESVRLNLRAPFYLSQLCVPHLIKTQGNIVNISSISAKNAFPAAIVYCTCKAGLDHFTRTLSMELAPQKVRVNSVNPGVIVTNFQRNAGMSEENYKVYLEKQKQLQPLGGAGDPLEVAKAIKFLASDESSFITGMTLFVDGGRHVLSPV